MGQNPRRPGFRLRWGEAERSNADAAAEAAPEQDARADEMSAPEPTAERPTVERPTVEQGTAEHGTAEQGTDAVNAASPESDVADAVAASSPTQAQAAAEEVPFLRDLVGAMRGVAESSRDSSLEIARKAVEDRVAELAASAAVKAEELRRTADLDVNGIAEWERTELERIRREAEKRRETRRAELEKQLAEHQSVTDAAVEATRARLADHERELDAFFAQLSEINDPAAFVAAAKRMPQPPDLTRPAESVARVAAEPKAAPLERRSATNGSPATAAPSDATLAQRLAQLDQRLSQGTASSGTASPEPATPETAMGPATPESGPATPESSGNPGPGASTVPAATASGAGAATAVEISTAIVVKGLGSFGAITSFKQALERVNGIRGVTLSLGPTGDFVYRASHASDFDLSGAIRSIEGPNVGIEESEGSLVVTIAGPR